MEGSILARRDCLTLDNGMRLRLLSALEVLQARREAEGLARGEALRAEGLSLRDAVRQAARETGLAKNELYDRAVGKTGGCE